jgi:uncharacterized heparinase superfamily protein
MPGVAVVGHNRQPLMSLRRGVHRTLGRVKSWVPSLPTLPGRGDRLVIAPQDLRTADPTRAAEIYSGRFAFAGKIVICDGRSPFEMIEPSQEWAETLLGFGWLRHLRAADTAITRANARALVDEWISLQGSWNAPPWQPEILSRRIMSWLSQATLILDEADGQFYRRFLRSLNKQVQFLRSTAKDTPDGVPRLQAHAALTYAALCIAGQMRHLPKATRQLVADLERQVLPDGGHASRNPGALIELLLDLLPLRQAFTARNIAPPAALINAIDRMMPMLRFFRHGDGTFGLFNGMGPTPPDLLATLIAYDDARGTPIANAIHSGYQRIDAGNSVLLMDTGRPPLPEMSLEAAAGCLSFEFSAKTQRIVVNAGIPGTAKENWREFARSTAAHSTVTFNNVSSCRFKDGRAITGGPARVAADREHDHDGTVVVRASHDGYAGRFSIIHQRTLVVSPDGNRIDGEDLFLSSKGDVIPAKNPDEFAVRFHLHPTIRATRVADGHGVMLVLPNRDLWNFHTYEDVVDLEDGAYLGGQDGPRRTLQIVIRGKARQAPRVRWTFLHTPQPARPGRAAREQDPELPLN